MDAINQEQRFKPKNLQNQKMLIDVSKDDGENIGENGVMDEGFFRVVYATEENFLLKKRIRTIEK